MGEDMRLTRLASCAGCGAKVGGGVLAKLLEGLPVHQDPRLLVGFDKSDDAAVYQITEDLALVQTLDFFPPIADDPYTFGQIAAANALSDIYAMGGEPKLALNIMCIPEDMPGEAVHAMLRGGYDKVYEAGAMIAGGHSILDREPKYGLSVTGFVNPQHILKNSGAKPGDILLLTKPLGIGILTTAGKKGLCSEEVMKKACSQMAALNKAARDCMVKYRVHACTDVTGFGLLGHAYEMAQGSEVQLELDTEHISILPEALALAEGNLPGGMERNRRYSAHAVEPGQVPELLQNILYDPETSGGLLMAVDPADGEALFQELQGKVPCAQKIGRAVEKKSDKYIILL